MATAEFLKAWRALSTRRPVLLVKIVVLTAAGASQAMYFGSAECQTPAGSTQAAQLWELGILDAEPIRAPGAFLTSNVSLCVTSLTLGRRKIGFQVAGKTLLDALKEYRWDSSAVVTYWWWDDRPLGDPLRLTSFDDAHQIFPGTIQTAENDGGRVTIHLRQRDDWNRDVAPKIASRGEYPRAPDAAIGSTIPTRYGRLEAVRARFPGITNQSTQRALELIAGGLRASRAVLVDTGRGYGHKAKVLVASHAVKQLGADLAGPYGTGQYLLGEDGRLHVVQPLVADLFTDQQGAGFTIPDNSAVAFFPILPTDLVGALTNPAGNPRNAMDADKEYTFTEFDYSLGKRQMQWKFPSVASQGQALAVRFFIIYSGNALAGPFRFGLENTPSGTFVQTLTDSAIPTWAELTFGGPLPLPTNAWDFSAWEAFVEFGPTSPAGTARVYALGLSVQYVPRQELLRERRALLPAVRRDPKPGFRKDFRLIRETLELQGSFFSNLHGYADDGAGTYSQLASGLIERAPDMATHMLVNSGGQALAQIERTASRFGSFVDARAQVLSWRQNVMVHGLDIGEPISMSQALSWLAQASCSWIYLDRFTDMWHFVPWRDGAAADYAWKFSRHHLVDPDGPKLRKMPGTDVASGVRVSYAYDAATQQYLHESSVGEGHSSAGHLYRNLRDGSLEVIAGQNDRIDFTTAGGTFLAILSAGKYTGIDAAVHARTQLKAADPARDFMVSYGATIVAGYNDKLDFSTGASTSATIPAGTYATMEALAAAAQTALNSVIAGWSVSYSRTSQKFTFTRGSSWLPISRLGTNQATCAWPVFGFRLDLIYSSNTQHSSDIIVEEERFVFASTSATLSFPWSSGANTARNAAEMYGFDPSEDTTGATIYPGYSPKTNLEQVFALGRPRSGPKREIAVEGRALYDTDTAREVRTRYARLAGVARMELSFATEYAPDIQRGQVIEFDADMDQVTPYTDPDSDGSWVGKTFVVIEVEQNLGPVAFHTRIEAVGLAAVTTPATVLTPSNLYVAWRDEKGTASDQAYAAKLNSDGALLWALQAGVNAGGTGVAVLEADVLPLADGGCIVAWHESRSGANDLFVQRFSATGIAQWGVGAINLCNDASTPRFVRICSDGRGGAIVGWCDSRSGTLRVFAQRVDQYGAAQWAANGVAISTAGAADEYLRIFPYLNGATFSWRKDSSAPISYVQYVSSSGVVQWTAGGVSLGAGNNAFWEPGTRQSSDGLLVSAQTSSNGSTPDIIAKKVTAAGAVQWTSGVLNVAGDFKGWQEACSDGFGGVFVLWWQRATPGGVLTLMCRRVDLSGTVQWVTPTSIQTSSMTGIGNELYHAAQPDGVGGMFVFWRTVIGTTNSVYIARVNAAGAILWGPILVDSHPTNPLTFVRLVLSGSGGVIALWGESGPGDLHARAVSSAGALLWATRATIVTGVGTADDPQVSSEASAFS